MSPAGDVRTAGTPSSGGRGLEPDVQKAWEDAVPQDADVPFSANWAKVWEATWGVDSFLTSFSDGTNSCLMPIHTRPLKDVTGLPEHHRHGVDAVTPWYFSGPLLMGGVLKPAVKGLMNELRAFSAEQDIANLFIRFHPILQNHLVGRTGIRLYVPGKVAFVDLTKPPQYHKGCAYAVKHAEDLGVRVTRDLSIEAFRGPYERAMEQMNAKPFHRLNDAFWGVMTREMTHNATVFAAHMPTGELAAMCLEVFRGPYVTDLLRVTTPEFRTSGATNLLLHDVFNAFRERGFQTVNLGGGYGGTGEKGDGQFDFKASFTDRVVPWYTGKVIWDTRRTLYKREKTYPEGTYFPSYRRVDHKDQVG